jgi:murein DD-endopeptidase MepM/ murein hydrolase activator NlpD
VHGFGNYLEIQHDFDMTTNYGHLQKFADGTMPGQRVVQGQIIGYVGSSGEATGPHLDYRVKRGGQYVNPLKMTFAGDAAGESAVSIRLPVDSGAKGADIEAAG